MTNKTYLSVQETAERLGINATTVYRLAQKGRIPGFKVGNQWRFSVSMLESWVADQVTLGWLEAEEKNGILEKREPNDG